MRNAVQIDSHLRETQVWSLLLSLAEAAAAGDVIRAATGVWLDARGRLRTAPGERGPSDAIIARPELTVGWSAARALPPCAAALLDLYMPLCVGDRADRLVIAHLGQSADGHLATRAGMGKFITGPEDIRHTHRLRALFDVVLVGASTIAVDDPLLTTRLVPGRTPVRVVLDPHGRLERQATVFRDRSAPTLWVGARPCGSSTTPLPPHVERLIAPSGPDGFDLHALLDALRARGLRRIFIEGGGVTVSRFLRAQLLDRVQLAIAPIRYGEPVPTGSPQLELAQLRAHGKRTRRIALGADTLFETELGPHPAPAD